MNKQEKNKTIDKLATLLKDNKNFYLADTSTLTGIKINNFRRACYEKQVEITVVKNTLLHKAMEKVANQDFTPMYSALTGNTALLFSEQPSGPARVIKQFRAENSKPTLKAAYVEESVYIGDEQLDILSSLKTKNELIADVVALLQSPAKRVIGALQSGSQKLGGIIKTLSEKEAK